METIRRNQHQFHRRMRRKCINLCADQQKRGEPLDPILSPVERNGITMAALRKLEAIAKQSKAPAASNRNFGVLQEVHSSSSGVTFQQSQGLSHNEPAPRSEVPFSICTQSSADNPSALPSQHEFASGAVQSKENESE